MKKYTFITSTEYKSIENEYRRKNGTLMFGKTRIETLLEIFPECREGSEEFFNFLVSEYKARSDYESKHGAFTYHRKTALLPEHIEEYSETAYRTKTVMFCMEREIGQLMFDDYRWNDPKVQEAYSKSKVAGNDYYRQFASNPELRDDVLDHMKDRTAYMDEVRRMDQAAKEAKHDF